MRWRMRDIRSRRRWESRWVRADYRPRWLSEAPRPQVTAAVESGWIPAEASVLDLGCGLGHTAAWLAERGHGVLAVDVSRAVIERATELHAGSGATFECGDVARPIQRTEPFDVVLDLGCLHQLSASDHQGFGDNVRRLTRPGSKVLSLMRVKQRTEKTAEQMVGSAQDVLGPGFELIAVELTEMQAPGLDKVRRGVELRFIRRS